MLYISKRTLLYPYLSVAFFLFIVLIDSLFLQGRLQNVLPKTISEIFIIYTVSELPHILASLFLLADSEYRNTYKKIFLTKTIPFVLCGLALYLAIFPLFFLIYIASTLYHVIMQQFGIAKMYTKEDVKLLPHISSVFIIIGSIFLLSCMVKVPSILLWLCTLLLLLLTCCQLFIYSASRKNFALISLLLSFSLSGILFATGYQILGLMSIRIVHDITAFIFYGTHNYNKKELTLNPFFNSRFTRKLNPFLFTVVLALMINFFYVVLLQETKENSIQRDLLFIIYVMTTLCHFHIEGFIWKRNSPARKYVSLS